MNKGTVFEGIVGQYQVLEKLKRDLEGNQIVHAYLFEGEKGLGKKSIALKLASALVCHNNGERPCGKCNSCMKAGSGNHPDIKVIENDGVISIDEIRGLISEMQLKPNESKCKVCIICDADKMNMWAQNALLKTLEEPPSYATLILLTVNANSLFPTIVSRCQVIKLYPADLKTIEHYLIKNKGVEKERAHMLAVFSRGVVGRAVELLDNPNFYYRREEVIKICNRLFTSDFLGILEQIKFFEEQRPYIEEILDLMISWYRDLFIYNETKNMEFITNID
ncbi:MAG TPA: DNA polymerase III subunit delta', partial [Clostridia bacterium]|nr:DNA polymerase III subunit delta' [Clostridia bacterium]